MSSRKRGQESGSRRLSLWESASFDFASLRSGITGAIVQSFLTINAGRVDTVLVAFTDLYGRY